MYFPLVYVRYRKRYKKVLDTLKKHGFSFILPRILFLKPFVKKKYKNDDVPVEKRLRIMMEELGPTFVKFGQFLSTRQDIIPEEYVEEFSKLTDKVSPVSYNEIQKVIETELGRKVQKSFKSFDKTPTASASIGQVHKAKLHTGEWVAVKVQKPRIQDQISADMAILKSVAQLAENRIKELEIYNLTGIVKEFEKTLREEINYYREGRNTDRIRRNFEDAKNIIIPKVFWNYTTHKVLVTSFIDGVKPDVWVKKKHKISHRKKIAEIGTNIYLKQIFIDGVFQADPHPGNLKIVNNSKIGFVDFGMVGYLDEDVRENITSFFISIMNKDSEAILEQMLIFGNAKSNIDRKKLKSDISRFINQYYGTRMEQFSAKQLVLDINQIMRDHNIKMQTDFMLLLKTMMQIESLGRMLYPKFNFIETARPFVKKVFLERSSPEYIKKKLTKFSGEFVDMFIAVPKKIQGILNMIEKGRLHVEFEHQGLEILTNKIKNLGNVLSISLVIASIILASSFFVSSDYPYIGIIGFILAGLLGISWAFKLVFS